MKTLKETFDYYDEGLKGYLTSHELKCCVIYFTGIKLSRIAMKRLKDKNSEFSFQDLGNIIASQLKEDHGSEVFNALDSQKKGYLTLDDFNNLCDVHAKYLKPSIRESVFREIDSNQDGMVTLRDIQRLVKFTIE